MSGLIATCLLLKVINIKKPSWNAEATAEKLKAAFPKGSVLSKGRLKEFLSLPGEIPNPVTLRTRLNALRKNQIISKIGKDQYSLDSPKSYVPEIDDRMRHIHDLINKKLPQTRFCVWKPSWLNEFSIHQSPSDLIVVESEHETEEAVFEVLSDGLKHDQQLPGPSLLFKPSSKDIDLYVSGRQSVIVVWRLISEAPLKKVGRVIVPRLEKILVDLCSETPFLEQYKGSEMREILRRAFESYTVNISTLRRYARRRGKDKTIAEGLAEISVLS